MSNERAAPDLQELAKKFLGNLRWTVEASDTQTLQAMRRVGGNESRWALHFED